MLVHFCNCDVIDDAAPRRHHGARLAGEALQFFFHRCRGLSLQDEQPPLLFKPHRPSRPHFPVDAMVTSMAAALKLVRDDAADTAERPPSALVITSLLIPVWF